MTTYSTSLAVTYLVTVEDEDGSWWEPVAVCSGSEITELVSGDYRRRFSGWEHGTYDGLVPAAYKVWLHSIDGWTVVDTIDTITDPS